MAAVKTNVIRILDKEKIQYTCASYEVKDGKIDGVAVAHKIGKPTEEVFKTLLVQGKSKTCYVCVIPVEKELDMKKISELTGEKNIEMLPVNDLMKTTGYIRGGCSPIGMKKAFRTFIDESAANLEKMTFSAGKVGVQVELKPEDLMNLVKAEYAVLTKA
ncbi:MAG: Cys-tRNA(Pro) deacylase [Clostridiales bacterium]|jgi:Cys-tRNA(Pro)/Cys-tRNA(Cys) deacylase|nr:Cys-tRNA(Pro) deacylase [Clostridiales bacterium]MDU6975457.1 Cys-tRNA(Pro) deacylase [Clostridiales bacterium]